MLTMMIVSIKFPWLTMTEEIKLVLNMMNEDPRY